MPEQKERPPTSFDKFIASIGGIVEAPAAFLREKVVTSFEKTDKPKYYHRRFRRVPTIDECYTDDVVCYHEANEQFKRDKRVDSEILNILRQRRLECELYHGPDAPHRCTKQVEDYLTTEENWFMKFGDLGAKGHVAEAYMKQKHRMIWERRHGPVGTGMKTQPQ